MEGKFAQQKIFSIPNLLSVVRIILIPVFVAFYFAPVSHHGVIAALVLIASGLTDILDGIIARKCGMVTELGQILDPLADKLTQATICVCMVISYRQLWPLLMLFIIKEALMVAGGARMMKRGLVIGSSKWFGKLATVVFYIVMISIIAFRPPFDTVLSMMLVALGFMLFSFIMYLRIFLKLFKQHR